MAYDEPTFRRHGGREPAGEPAMSVAGGYSAADYPGGRREQSAYDQPTFGPDAATFGRGIASEESGVPDVAPVSPADPVLRASAAAPYRGPEGEASGRDNGRDRLRIHFGWELILLLATAAIGFFLYRLDPASLQRPALDTLLVSGTVLGLLTLGAGLTLRAGVANLAIGPIAIAAALHFAENGDQGLLQAAGPAAGIAAIGGLVVGVIVVVFHVPGWAATLAAGMGAIVFIELRNAPVNVQGGFDPSDRAVVLFGGFAVLAVLGGALGTVPPIRRLLGRLRPEGDPAARRGAAVVLPVIASLMVSSVLAVVAGVLLAANSPAAVVPDTGLQWTGLGLGLALVAGTSAFGRRGGVFGTVLAVAGMTLFLDYADRRDLGVALFAAAGCLVAAGLVVTRLIERFGGPRPQTGDGDDWQSENADPRSVAVTETWSPSVPAQRTPDRWLDDRWGQTPR